MKMKYGASFLLVGLLFATVLALPDAYFSHQEDIINFVRQQPTDSIQQAYYATSALKGLNAEKHLNTKALCDLAAKTLSSASNIENIFYAVHVAETLECGKELSQAATAKIFSTIDSSDSSIEQLYFATAAAFLLKHNGHLKIENSDLAPVLDVFSERSSLDGTVKNVKQATRGDLYSSGLALYTASLFNRTALDKDRRALIRELKDSAVIDAFSSSDEGYYYFDRQNSRSPLTVTSAILRGALNLGIKVDQDIIKGVTQYVLAHQQATNLEEAHNIVELISALASNKAGASISVSLAQTTLTLGVKGEGNVRVRVSDLLGRPIDDVKVYLIRATSFRDSQPVVSNQALHALEGSDTDFEFNFLAAKPEKGFYELEFGVQVGKQQMVSTVRTVKVLSSVALDSVQINVVDSSDKEIVRRLTVKAKQPFDTFTTTYFYLLDFSFVIRQKISNKPTSVQQAFIRVSGNGVEHTYPTHLTGDKHQLSLNLKNIGADLHYRSGEYLFELIVGDFFIDNPFVWTLGSININYPASAQATVTENVYVAKPEISHKFRVPDTRPSASTSFLFTCLVLAPFAIVVLGIPVVGVNVKIPGGLGFIYAVVFFGTIVAIFGLYFLFWVSLNMFDTLKYLGGLSLIALWSGKSYLRDRAARREKPKQE